MGLSPTQGDEKRFGSATTFYGAVALPFVIPSEAEGSAVSLNPQQLFLEVEPQMDFSSRVWL
jgi:hypothetical protein